jgi:hypothetical protein
MTPQTQLRAAATVLVSVLMAALVASPVPVAGHRPFPKSAAPRERSADLAPALGADGSFRGTPGLAGTVDASAWTLVSNLAAGEPPRFAPTASAVSPSAAGPWSALGSNGSGNGAYFGPVTSIAVSGSDLYVGGAFSNAAGIPEADFIAMWDGTAWSALGSNGSGNGALMDVVVALAVSGTDLYVGGLFMDAAGIPEADFVAKWNGSAWSALGSNGSGDGAIPSRGVGDVLALAVSGGDLFVGGRFVNVAGIPEADHVAKWNGSAWSALGSNGSGYGAINGYVYALAVSGNDLYVGGLFERAAGIPGADGIARWNGSAWSALGSNGAENGYFHVYAIAVSGSDVYAGGYFNGLAGIATADYIAKWNGTAWSALGSNGSGHGALKAPVYALAFSGPNLFVGGGFNNAAGNPLADRIAKWNGHAWSALGSNGSGDGALNARVGALAISGGDLYVGGGFTNAAGIPEADWIAKWTPETNKPDGRIRRGTGAFVGNDIYNTTGLGQSRSGSAAPGNSVTFRISIQNDGTSADRIGVDAAGAAVDGYSVRYFRGTTDITAAVVAGTYQTWSLAPGAAYLITARVTVHSAAAVGSHVTRLVTLTSVGDGAKKDAVKFIGKHA